MVTLSQPPIATEYSCNLVTRSIQTSMNGHLQQEPLSSQLERYESFVKNVAMMRWVLASLLTETYDPERAVTDFRDSMRRTYDRCPFILGAAKSSEESKSHHSLVLHLTKQCLDEEMRLKIRLFKNRLRDFNSLAEEEYFLRQRSSSAPKPSLFEILDALEAIKEKLEQRQPRSTDGVDDIARKLKEVDEMAAVSRQCMETCLNEMIRDNDRFASGDIRVWAAVQLERLSGHAKRIDSVAKRMTREEKRACSGVVRVLREAAANVRLKIQDVRRWRVEGEEDDDCDNCEDCKMETRTVELELFTLIQESEMALPALRADWLVDSIGPEGVVLKRFFAEIEEVNRESRADAWMEGICEEGLTFLEEHEKVIEASGGLAMQIVLNDFVDGDEGNHKNNNDEDAESVGGETTESAIMSDDMSVENEGSKKTEKKLVDDNNNNSAAKEKQNKGRKGKNKKAKC